MLPVHACESTGQHRVALENTGILLAAVINVYTRTEVVRQSRRQLAIFVAALIAAANIVGGQFRPFH